MLSNKDYANMTLEDLKSEQGKMKSGKNLTAGYIGVLIGIAVYAAAHKGFLLTIMLLIAALYIARNNTQKTKAIEAEINRREHSDKA
jgi:hypothetical protein